MVCNDHTDSFTFFTAHWFYAILPNVPSDLPALLPPQKTFSWYQWGLFLHLYSRFFLWMSPRCEDHWWFYFLWIFYEIWRRKAIIYLQSDQSHVLCWIYSYIDPSWQNFCSALFLLPVFSCHVLSDLSGLFIFYKRFSTYAPLFSHHCTQKVRRSGNLW